jgi:hypothetical protein
MSNNINVNSMGLNLIDILSQECKDIIKTGSLDDKICVFVRFWSTEDCHMQPESLFIFGDNDIKKGCGGQAIIRYCKNTIGIPTKKLPNNKSSSFYTDNEFEDNCRKIIDAISLIIKKSVDYGELVFPFDGFGTGLAKLPENAPKTLEFLEKLIYEVFGVDYSAIRSGKFMAQFDTESPNED